jgi:hypothetical protein
MSMKHTPGPWINDGREIAGRPDPENSQTYIAPICKMDEEWAPEIAAANARLIAAAPMLFRRLEELHKAVTMRPCGQGGLSYAERASLDAARALLREIQSEPEL